MDHIGGIFGLFCLVLLLMASWVIIFVIVAIPTYIVLGLYAGLKFLGTNLFILLDKLFYPGFDAPAIAVWGFWGLISGIAIQGYREMRIYGRKGIGTLIALTPILLLVLTGTVRSVSIPDTSDNKPTMVVEQNTEFVPGYKDADDRSEQVRSAGKKRMAIFTFEDKSGIAQNYGGLLETITDDIVTNVLNNEEATEFLDIISREQVEAIMTEQNLDFSERFDNKTVARIGQVAGVHELVIGKITQLTYTFPRTKSIPVSREGTLRIPTGKYVDEKGKIRTKYSDKKVSATFIHYTIESSVTLIGSYQIIDVKTAKIKKSERFTVTHDFSAEWGGDYRGNEDALGKMDKQLISRGEQEAPLEENMVFDAGEKLSAELSEKLIAAAHESQKKPGTSTKPATAKQSGTEKKQNTPDKQTTTTAKPTAPVHTTKRRDPPFPLPVKPREIRRVPPQQNTTTTSPKITEPAIPSTPENMVLIPAGYFQMGSGDSADEQPVHTIYIDAFYIDKYEVTNAQYKIFLQANPQWRKDRIASVYHDGDYLKHWNGNNYPTGKANHPVTYVSWYAAMAYAEWTGKRLPTEAEWEKAARGGLVGKKYPWGDSIDSAKANCNKNVGDTTPVGGYSPNAHGLHDMSGNVAEWCLDTYDADFYRSSSRQNPVSGGSALKGTVNFSKISTAPRVLRGGSWSQLSQYVRVADRTKAVPTLSYFGAGFRCVKVISR